MKREVKICGTRKLSNDFLKSSPYWWQENYLYKDRWRGIFGGREIRILGGGQAPVLFPNCVVSVMPSLYYGEMKELAEGHLPVMV